MARRAMFLFGVPRTLVDGSERPLARRKSVALLAYLAVTQRRFERETLAALLWPDADRASGLAILRQCLADVRRTLGDDVLRESRGWVEAGSSLQCDVTRFESLAGARTLASLEEAVAISAGGFLDGFYLSGCEAFESWQESYAAYLDERRRAVLERLVVRLLDEGRPEQAQGFVAELLRVAPWADGVEKLAARVEAAARGGRTGVRGYRGRQARVATVAVAAVLALAVLVVTPGSPVRRVVWSRSDGPFVVSIRVGPEASGRGSFAPADELVEVLTARLGAATRESSLLAPASIFDVPKATLEVTVGLEQGDGWCRASLAHGPVDDAWSRSYWFDVRLITHPERDPQMVRSIADDLAARIVTSVLGYLARSGAVPVDPTINPPI